MTYIDSNKKKVRGWKKQVRRLNEWKRRCLQPDLSMLKEYSTDYVKIWIDPWYRLTKRTPPLWYCRLILEAFGEMYDSWFQELSFLDQPFYLKLWVRDPRFYYSQLVAAVGDKISWNENLFVLDEEPYRPIPKIYETPAFDLRNYQWTACIDEEFLWKYNDELDEQDIQEAEKLAWRIEETSDGDTLYRFRQGTVWVGTKISSGTTNR